jgi:outer membrane protein TolC
MKARSLLMRRVSPWLSVLCFASAAVAQTPPAVQVAPVAPANAPPLVTATPASSIPLSSPGTPPVPTTTGAAPAGPAPLAPAGAPASGGVVGNANVARKNVAAERLEQLRPVPGGWTADSVALRSRATSYDVAAKHEALKAAAARVDQAIVGFFPRISGVGRYTRNSAVPAAGFGSLVAPGPGATVGPGGTLAAGSPLLAFPLSFPAAPVDSYLIQGSVTVPITDYFLRISHNYAAASHNEDAARYDKLATEAKSVADGRIAFYNWVKSAGQFEVLKQAQIAAQEHAKDADVLFKAGQASKADVMQAQSQVASGSLTVAQAEEYMRVAEEQLRIMTHSEPDEPVVLGEDVISELPRTAIDVNAMRQEAISTRAELKSLSAGEQGLDRVSSLSRAAAWPQLSAFGDLVYANPNQRIFPQVAKFTSTWDVGIQLVWSPNDLGVALGAGAEADANTAKLRAQRAQVRDGILIEVMQAVQAMKTADSSVDATNSGISASEEAYRVRREMYRVGKATSVELTDAEATLFRAKLSAVSARIDQRIARVRLEHATGRDLAKLAPKQ